MTITDVRVRKIASEGKMKAIVSVTFDNEFVVHDIKIIEGQNGLFIAMPAERHQMVNSKILHTQSILKQEKEYKVQF